MEAKALTIPKWFIAVIVLAWPAGLWIYNHTTSKIDDNEASIEVVKESVNEVETELKVQAVEEKYQTRMLEALSVEHTSMPLSAPTVSDYDTVRDTVMQEQMTRAEK